MRKFGEMSLILAHAIVGVAAWSAMLSVVAGVLVTLALLALDMWSATRDRFRGVLGLAWVPFIILATFVVAKGVNPGHYQVAVETGDRATCGEPHINSVWNSRRCPDHSREQKAGL